MSKYRLIVKLPNVTLNFHIDEYEIVDGSFYRIFDSKSRTYRIYDTRICDLVEVRE